MDERTMQLRLGAAVLASLVIVVIMLTFLGTHKNFLSPGYTIYIKLDDAPGVVENTPIYQSGLLIGRVKKVDLMNENGEEGVLVTAIIDGRPLYHNQQCQLTTKLLGDAYLNMVRIPYDPENPAISDRRVEKGETLQGKIAFDPVALIEKFQERMATAITDVSHAASKLEKVAGSADEMIQENRQNVKAMIQNTSQMIADSHAFVKDISGLINDDELQESVRATIVRLPKTMDKMDATVDSLRTNINSATGRLNDTMEQMSGKMDHSLGLADKALTNVLKITDPLASKTEIWLGNIDNILQNLDVFTDAMVNPNGTVGLLLRDRSAYDKLFQTMDRVNHLSQQLEPIVYNAQVFSEKIAQHPELLGVRGALFPNSGASGKDVPPPRGVKNYGGSGTYGNLDFYNTTQPTCPKHGYQTNPAPGNDYAGKMKAATPRAPSGNGTSPAVTAETLGIPQDVFQRGEYEVISDGPVSGGGNAGGYPAGGAASEPVVYNGARLKQATPTGNHYQARVAL